MGIQAAQWAFKQQPASLEAHRHPSWIFIATEWGWSSA